MYGTTQSGFYYVNNLIPSNIISKSTNSSCIIINHSNSEGKTKTIYNESNDIILILKK